MQIRTFEHLVLPFYAYYTSILNVVMLRASQTVQLTLQQWEYARAQCRVYTRAFKVIVDNFEGWWAALWALVDQYDDEL